MRERRQNTQLNALLWSSDVWQCGDSVGASLRDYHVGMVRRVLVGHLEPEVAFKPPPPNLLIAPNRWCNGSRAPMKVQRRVAELCICKHEMGEQHNYISQSVR